MSVITVARVAAYCACLSLRPSQVFTPNKFPLQENNVYASRSEAERGLAKGMDRGEVPIVYGEFGVGKTTLVKRFFLEEEDAGSFIHVLTPSGKNMADIVQIVLEHIGYEVQTTRELETASKVGGEIEGGFLTVLKAKPSGEISEGETETRELVVSSPTDQGFLKITADRELTVAIDEMHKASPEFAATLAETLKATNNLGLGYPRFVLLGTTLDATRLVQYDNGIDRFVREVRVRPMTEDEATSLIEDGFQRLQVTASPKQVKRIVATAAGAPTLLQEMGLDVSEAAYERGDSVAVRDQDIDDAIHNFLTHSQARLTKRYMLAINTTGSKQYRKQILRAMAENDNEYVTMDQLVERVSGLVGATPSSALSGPLRELKTQTYGTVLVDVERPLGERAHNLTTFQDPRMKAFIRAMLAVEAQGLLPGLDQLEDVPDDDS